MTRLQEQQKMLLALAQAAIQLGFSIERGEVIPHAPNTRVKKDFDVTRLNSNSIRKTPVSIYRRLLVMANVGGAPVPINKKKQKEFFQACRWLDGVCGGAGQLNATMTVAEILPRFAAILLRMIKEDVKMIDHTGFYLSPDNNWKL